MRPFLKAAMLVVAAFSALAPAPLVQSGPTGFLQVAPENRNLPSSAAGLRLPAPRHASGASLDGLGLGQAKGIPQVVIHLNSPPITALGTKAPADQQTQMMKVQEEQQALLSRMGNKEPGFKVLARLRLVLNAVIAEVDPGALELLSNDLSVSHVSPVIDYELALSETVPYIGGSTAHDLGVDGSGVRVAVIDTGIDYTHLDLGGPGTREAFEAAFGSDPTDPRNTTNDGLFPTAKVIGGFDFVGESWPSGPLAPDPDPIDFNGHGTHVADIIGGLNGVAPGVKLYALKACGSQSGGCSGVALLQAMEFAVDPNGDGNTNDHVDIVNMSLGASYGQPFDDALSAAVDNATRLGVLTVAAAGNGGDRPYITATPGAATTAISVAQTQVPSTFMPTISVMEPAASKGEYPAALQPWAAPVLGVIQGPVQYGNGAGGNLDGCAPFEDGSLDGKIVVIDRGTCFFSDKVRHIQEAGGILGVIALVAPGPPFESGFGGGSPITIPAYTISQPDGDILRRSDAVIRAAPGQGISLAGSVVDTSSRGPEFQSNRIKPELTAPGASISAEAGTGSGRTPFGGTSGATPMVAGAAALLIQGHTRDRGNDPEVEELERAARLTPLEVKARLMNTAEVNLRNSPDGTPAPISRVGGGEVRIDRALAAPVAAWDAQQPSGALSFGFLDVAEPKVTLTKRVLLRNYSREKVTFRLKARYQFADDASNGAVTLSMPDTVSVDGGTDVSFQISLNIDGAKLRDNLMNSGPQGNDPRPLTTNEYDGYLVLDDGEHPIHLAWHVLPRKSARLALGTARLDGDLAPYGAFALIDSMEMTNTGVGNAQNEAYSLLALSPRLERGGRGQGSPTPDLRAIGVNTFEVGGGFCSENPSYVLAFAVNTWERQTHANWPGIFQFNLDTDQDGSTDYLVFNADGGLESGGSQGQNLTWVLDPKTGDASAYFFTQHAMNTANTVLYFCAEQIGQVPPHQEIDIAITALDDYFGGPGDVISGITFAPFEEAFLSTSLPDVPASETEVMAVSLITEVAANRKTRGLLLLTNGDRGPSNRGGATADTEALVLIAPVMDRASPTSSVPGNTQR